MSEGNLKWLLVAVGAFALYSFVFSGSDTYNVNIDSKVHAADGLDLKAVGSLIKKAETAENLEKLINDKSEGINNLDLDEDGNVDYIKVTEYGETGVSGGFSLSTELAKGEVQEIATIEIEKAGEGANVQIKGNQQIYGQGHYYNHYYPSIGTYLFLGWMFRPHPFYYSRYGFGYYPSYYSPYRRVGYSTYHSRVSSRGSAYQSGRSSKMSSNLKSPNAGKSSSRVRAPLKNPTASQKSFQKRNPSKRARSGGFGRSRSARSSGRRRSGGFSFGK